MGILGGCDLNDFVLIDEAVALNFMRHERISELAIPKACPYSARLCRECSEPKRNVAEAGVHHVFGLRRSVNVDCLRGAGGIQPEEIIAHYISEAEIVVRVKMGKENCPDIFGRDVGFEHAAHRSDAAVN